MEFLYKVADEISPKNILEIGGAEGCSSIVLGYVAKKHNGQLQTIEPNKWENWDINIETFGLTQYVSKITGYSPWIDMDKINTPIDFLFIDGNHATKCCLRDYYYFSEHIRKHGRIGFHDVHSVEKGPGLRKAMKIILETDNVKQIYDFRKVRGIVVMEKQ